MSPQGMARTAARLTAIAGACAGVTSAHLLEIRLRGSSDASRGRAVRLWARLILRILNVRLQIAPSPRPPSPTGATLVVANHRSTVDIPLVLSLSGGHLLSRDDVAGWPVFGRMAALAGTIFVDRASPGSGAMAVRRIRERLSRGATVCVFPEGGTFIGDEVRSFRSGAFIAAARERAAILPIGIAYADEASVYGEEPFSVHARRLASAPATSAAVVIGSPIANSSGPAREIAARTRETVQALVSQARALIGPK
jgi:lyso-ornithine lipid O-acyltransferase